MTVHELSTRIENITAPKYCGNKIRWNYIRKYLPKSSGGDLLDVGAGNMEYKSLVESKGYTYTGIDIDPRSPAQRGSITDIPFPNEQFSTVISVDVLEHIKNDDKAIKEIFRVLQDGGLLILHVPNKNQRHILFEKPVEHKDHVREGYDPFDIHHLFFNFTNISYYPTFDRLESVAWDLTHAMMNNIPINPNNILDCDGWENYGWIIIARK
ncbi:MAG: class I SAM-dependent methyltransferase [Candidatus Daviesbacteria bacterium]|nr:class I SAM-dependent methyltransferase [Candidatus Daviesbacteria bacterium]